MATSLSSTLNNDNGQSSSLSATNTTRRSQIITTIPSSSTAGLAGPLSLFPATSPLATYPSPFSEHHVAEVKDLLRRTYSTIQENSYTTPSDRIGRNYTPTAVALSMKMLQQRLADPSIGARLVAGNAAAQANTQKKFKY